ncbi:MAG: hypothetical protein ACRC6X_09250 [Culicoidibacterales bacterium]
MKIALLDPEYHRFLIKSNNQHSKNRLGVIVSMSDGMRYFLPISKSIEKTKEPYDDRFESITHKNKKIGTISIIDFTPVSLSLYFIQTEMHHDILNYVRKHKKEIKSKFHRILTRCASRNKQTLQYYNAFEKDKRDANVSLARRKIQKAVESMSIIEDVRNREQLARTFFYGEKLPANLAVNDIIVMNNLKVAWEELVDKLYDNLTVEWIIDMNKQVARNQALAVGEIKIGENSVTGFDETFIIKIPPREELSKKIADFNNKFSTLDLEYRAISLFLYCMLSQFFWDGNKRTAFITLNKILISNGIGIIIIGEEHIREFHRLLYFCFKYNNRSSTEKFIAFISEKCLIKI